MAWNDYIGLDSDETFNINVSVPNLNSNPKSNTSEETKNIDLSSYAKKTNIPDVTNLATKANVIKVEQKIDTFSSNTTNEIDSLKSKNIIQDTAIEENSKSISELVTKVDTNKTEATQTIETLKTKDTAMETNISLINTTLNSKANLVNGKVPKNEVYNQFQDLGYHSINFDTFKEPGVFHINYTACIGNTKPQGIENGLLITHKYNDTWVVQEYITWGNRIFRRTTRDNIWTSWREI